jgi:hypothetical protein
VCVCVCVSLLFVLFNKHVPSDTLYYNLRQLVTNPVRTAKFIVENRVAISVLVAFVPIVFVTLLAVLSV